MLRILLLTLAAPTLALAQGACPTAADLAAGIVLTRESGATDTYAGDQVVVAHEEQSQLGARTELLARGYLPISQQDEVGLMLTDWGAEPEALPLPEPGTEWQRDVTYSSPGYTVGGQAGIQAGEAYQETVGGCPYTSVPVQLWLGDGSVRLTYLVELGVAYESIAPQDYVVGIAAVE